MAEGKFFAPKHDMGKHPSMRSHLRGLQASTLKLALWRREREAALEAGHRPPELCYEGEPDGHFQGSRQDVATSQHGFTPQLELDLLTPYVDHLKEQVEHDVIKVPSGVIFSEPEVIEMARQNRINKIGDELQDIADSAKYSGDGKTL